MEIGIKKAKDQLSRLLLRVFLGEEITITRKGVPIARLIGVEPKPSPRKLGAYRDKIWIADDFDAPLPPEILAGFLGEAPSESETQEEMTLMTPASRCTHHLDGLSSISLLLFFLSSSRPAR